MASNGIRDRVAIVGMGCTSFGERWDKSVSDLLVDATKDATASAGIDLKDVDAFWLGTLFSGQSGLTLSRPLKIDYKPVSRLENFCATGSEAFRNACYAVAAGAYDIAMAIGVEKLKDSGFSGLPSTRSVGDGTAAIIVRAEDAHRYTDKPLYVKALSFVAGPGSGPIDPDYDYTTFNEVVASAADAYAQAGIKEPRQELAMAEVHDCFTPTELVLMEDLGFAARGTGWKEVLAGTFDLEGELAVNPDGGLKSFGHPIGASGLRMLFECWLQLRGEAGKRQIASVARGRKLALTHNLGGAPGECVSFVGVVGSEKSA